MNSEDKQNNRAEERERMVRTQLVPRGIRNERVLDAFLKVQRQLFIPDRESGAAYGDHPLPIGCGQTISQPFMVASMTELLELTGTERVLEIGTGSGYQTAILAELSAEVFSMDRVEALSLRSTAVLEELGYTNVSLTVGDGTLGWPEHAPFDGIMVTAGSPCVPKPLVEQLADGGRLVIPVGGGFSQVLTVVRKEGAKVRTEEMYGCMFVPLIGKHGWDK